MIICGIDQSTKKTGWSVFKNGKLIAYGNIPISDKYKADVRMKLMTEKISDVLVGYVPDKVYFEQTFMKGGVNGFRTLCNLQGFIMYELQERAIPYQIVEESKWAKNIDCCKGKREERKQLTLRTVETMFGIDLKGEDDVADAIGIGWYGVCQERKKYGNS